MECEEPRGLSRRTGAALGVITGEWLLLARSAPLRRDFQPALVPAGTTVSDSPNCSPRLLCLSDVPVEASYAGSVLLYRLLQGYPPDRLRVLETNLARSIPERRLSSVNYAELRLGLRRPLYTRFSRWYAAWLTFRAAAHAAEVSRLMNGFSPDAVLTVTHGFSWRTAARFAADKQLPLHLICHDDLPRMDHLPDRFGSWIDNEFGRIYRQAKSRLCVSPFMAETYQARYGPGGTVLLPSRAADALVFTAPPREQLGANARPFTCVFAGSLSTLGYVRALRVLADALLPLQGRLLLFTPLTPERVAGAGLGGRNVEIRGLLESPALIKRCRDEADMLFVPMSFERVDKANTEISFPSKLTDYTVMGLPLLIQGPTYSSAVRWARDYPGVAEVVDTDDADRLAEAVKRLERNPEYRTRLAAEALAVGNRLFSHATAWATFHGALTRGPGPVPLG